VAEWKEGKGKEGSVSAIVPWDKILNQLQYYNLRCFLQTKLFHQSHYTLSNTITIS